MTPPGPPELLLIAFIVVLLFGAKKLPELSRSVGKSISSFKEGVREANEESEDTTAADATDSDPGAESDHDRDSRKRDNA